MAYKCYTYPPMMQCWGCSIKDTYTLVCHVDVATTIAHCHPLLCRKHQYRILHTEEHGTLPDLLQLHKSSHEEEAPGGPLAGFKAEARLAANGVGCQRQLSHGRGVRPRQLQAP